MPESHDVETQEGALAEQTHDQEVQPWLAAMERDMRIRKRVENAYALMGGLGALLWFIALCFRHMNSTTLILVAEAVLLIPAIIVALLRPRLKSNAARWITQLDDVRYVGPVVDIWNGNTTLKYDRRTRDAAQEALTRLLPRLRAEDAAQLKETHRAQLRNVLTSPNLQTGNKRFGPDFQLAVILAFEQIGDWSSAKAVEYLTFADDRRVREAARRCAPVLKQLAQRRMVGETLLRASDVPAETKPETLLRPAAGAGGGDEPEELLRAAPLPEVESAQ